VEVVVLAGMAACVAAAYVALRLSSHPERKRARRILAAAPPLAASSVDGAVVRVTGVVRAYEGYDLFSAPLSGTRCVAYRTRVVARRGRYAYASVHEELITRPFVVVRGDGEAPVIVDSRHVVFDLAPHRQTHSLTRKVELLRALGLADANAAQSHFEQVMIAAGATVTIAGTLARTLDAAASGGERTYRDGATETLRLVGDQAHPVAVGPARE
jgi:hypothetical protein